jgi:radical SAM superfamily enzyme YgiQ (UPF0313 family)
MKIAFIRPNMGKRKSADAMQPLAFAVLSALTPPETEIVLYDDRIEEIPFDLKADVAAISVETFTAKRAYCIAQNLRRRGIRVVMGGYHPTFLPEEALQYADAVVLGEAENTWPQVIADLKQDTLKRVYQAQNPPELQGICFDRSIFKGKKYGLIYPVQFGRGCMHHCEFCSIHAFYGHSLRQRPVQEVMEEIRQIKGKYYFITDDNLLAGGEKTREILKALKPLQIQWATQVSIELSTKPELLALMAESGCIAVIVGFESLEKKNLEQMGKKININNFDYMKAVKAFQQHGIMIYGTFVFGYDYDTPDSIKRSLDFAIESKMMIANFNTLMPMPGTRLYERFAKEGRLIHEKWWLDPKFKYGDAMFHPRGMTAEELTEGCYQARREFNKWSVIVKRGLEFKTNCRNLSNLRAFLLTNFISRHEIYRKQGVTLGEADNDDVDNY